MGIVAAATIGFFAFVGGRLVQPPMALLYGSLDLKDSGAIAAKLDGMKVPYQLGAGGAQVLVPENQVLRLRVALAEGGLPSGGSVGYEIFDRADALGTTSFVQNINLVRALEGELARTIRAIDGVQSARVHLVLPKREVFSREQREPSASIVLRLRGGRIDQNQVRAIQNLTASAVPDLKPGRVAIVDDQGKLLASGMDDRDAKAGSVARVAEMRAGLEERLKRAVETLLERTVGPGNVRAEVSVDMDYDRITTNSESYDPDGQVVRSTQTVAEQNQAAEGAQNVTVANNLPEAAGGAAGQSQSRGQRTEETVNYEISKTVKSQVREAGVVRRVSVAVLVNGVTAADGNGARTYQPRSEEQLKQLAALARSAIGFDEKRGDTVEVVNLRFAEPDVPPEKPADEPNFFDLYKNDMFRIGEMVGYAVLALMVMLMVVRPMVSRILSAPIWTAAATPALAAPASAVAIAAPAGGTAVATPALPPGLSATALPAPGGGLEQMIDVARIEGQVKASSIKKIGEIIDRHPEEAVAIVRNWLYQSR